MNRFAYDLHIHSCLSPCADDDMTPATIAGIGKLNGLSVMALTDHNSTRNCPAFFEACRFYGVCPIAGMELTTAEEIHLLCLFSTLEAALDFEKIVNQKRVYFQNRADIFGQQTVMDAEDCVLETVPYLLSYATLLTVDEAVSELRAREAFVCPAHIDREANGMIGVLGTVPPEYGFSCVELRDKNRANEIREAYGINVPHTIFDSDAHTLLSLSKAENYLELPVAFPKAEDVIRSLL